MVNSQAEADTASERVLLVGATSGIGAALAKRLAARNCRLVLAARNHARLEKLAAELVREFETSVAVESFQAREFDQHSSFLERCYQHFEGLDGAVVGHGILPTAEEAERDFQVARDTIETNFLSVVSLVTPLAMKMRSEGRGWIAVISSVAGDRGRQSNYVYGSSKAGLSAFLGGLRNRLYREGVHVLTIKPGYVATPMIEGRMDDSSPLVATPETVARDIDRAIQRRRDVLYTPWFWIPIMAVVRAIPEFVFKRLRT